MIEQQLESDIKTALLAGDKGKVISLRSLKAALLSYKVAQGKRDSGITDDEVIQLLAKEAKKRQESADLFVHGGRPDRAEAELAEKALIESYLPAKLSDDALRAIIDEVINATGANSAQDLGMVMGQVKTQVGTTADGAVIAQIVKQKLGA